MTTTLSATLETLTPKEFIRISGGKIVGSTGYGHVGVLADIVTRCKVEGVNFVDCENGGVILSDAYISSVENCRFEDSGAAVILKYGTKGCLITGNKGLGLTNGVRSEASTLRSGI